MKAFETWWEEDLRKDNRSLDATDIAMLPVLKNFAKHIWRAARQQNTTKAGIVNLLCRFSSEERMEIFNKFCVYCGSANPHCYCMRDD